MKFEKIILKNQANFETKDIFECGQCFRWKKEIDGSYTGVVSIGLLNVRKNNQDIIIKGYILDNSDLNTFCQSYFDLEVDYLLIQNEISKNDKTMRDAISYGSGIRILNQDPWEMLISYIISAANNIPRISKCINNISERYGRRISLNKDIKDLMFEFDNKSVPNTYYFFPKPNELIKSCEKELRECNLGFRDKFVYGATKLVTSEEIDLNTIMSMPYKEAKKELTKMAGVGDKVADCILLFSMQKSEAFPVDTWIKKIMNEVYVDSQNVKKINEYAFNKWGKNAGIAQQYLFYYKRNRFRLVSNF